MEDDMADEYWATFSIFDHRGPLYRKALVLFDRVVMPVPTVPVGRVEQPEIDALSADADYLVNSAAAVRFDWDPDEFFEWREGTVNQDSLHGEALAKVLANDPPYATRLQLSQKYTGIAKELLPEGVDSVTAVPVYGSPETYDNASANLYTAERKTLEITLKHIPVPADDTPLEDIIGLRKDAQFQNSLIQLRKWQGRVVNDILFKGSNKVIRDADAELEHWIAQYRQAMKTAEIKKVATVILSMIAIGASLATGAGPAILLSAKLASPLWTLRELSKPCWKEVADKQCAPAGVVYVAEQLAE
jgi:hypothetical protein